LDNQDGNLVKSSDFKGKNTIFFEITKDVENPTFQLDLQKPMNSKNFMGKSLYLGSRR
jgi:hypothetical protein